MSWNNPSLMITDQTSLISAVLKLLLGDIRVGCRMSSLIFPRVL